MTILQTPRVDNALLEGTICTRLARGVKGHRSQPELLPQVFSSDIAKSPAGSFSMIPGVVFNHPGGPFAIILDGMWRVGDV